MIPVIIPAYEPDNRLINLIKNLIDNKIGPIIIINDGSSHKYDDIFIMAKQIIEPFNGIYLEHNINKGKGRALKTAFNYVLENMPHVVGVVTADSDGQHTTTCISKIIEYLNNNPNNLILGVRKFTCEGIPWKSKFGNKCTEKIFQYISGIHVTDTQTGLRGIPINYLTDLLTLPGERFEFEMRMLLDATNKYKITEVQIVTIYDSKENHQTHFDPFKDSFKIYKILIEKFLKYIFASLSSSLLDIVLFSILCIILRKKYENYYLIYSTIIARIISALYNYLINYKIVFKGNGHIIKSLFKYIILAIIQVSLSACFVFLLARSCRFIPEIICKIIIDTLLFFLSYYIQQRFVF